MDYFQRWMFTSINELLMSTHIRCALSECYFELSGIHFTPLERGCFQRWM